MRKVYCYAEKEEKPEEIDHSGDIVQDLSSLDISDIKNRRFFFIGGEIIENPYYEPSEYMKRVYESIDAQYEKFYRSDNDKKDSDEKDDAKDAEEEINEQSSDDDMPDWIAEMPYGELIKRFPGGISEALEYAKKEKGLSVPEVHYDSPEPEKLGVKAFTKNAEVYLAPGEGEETLKHELGHVVQQKKEKIPATTKIGEQQVNLDPKFEQEADEIAEHIEDHITEIISNESTNTETKNIVQFAPISDEDLRKKILEEALELKIPHVLIAQELDNIIDQYRTNESSWLMWFDWFLRPPDWSKDYVQTCIIEALEKIKSQQIQNQIESELYSGLKESTRQARPEDKAQENKRITEIMAMLSTEKIFRESENVYVTLHTIMQWLTPEQCEEIKNYILKLKTYCNADGIKSVLRSANINSVEERTMLRAPDSDDTADKKSQKKSLAESFVKRMQLITNYVESIYTMFNGDYWIQSTGSDLHNEGKHALFLINKETKVPQFVYKPHDLSADNAVVGKEGMLAELNRIIDTTGSKIDGELAFSTMDINVEQHIEEFVTKKEKMTQDEAKKYFYRAGMLKIITDAMAVIDLHRDNIMPVINHGAIAPLIIDAEVDFFEYATSGLENDALVSHKGRNTNASFIIEGGGENGEDLESGKAFEDKLPGPNNEYSNSIYRQIYIQGYNFMLNQMKTNIARLKQLYNTQLDKVEKVRILPLATKDFSKFLDGSYETPNKDIFASQLATVIQTQLTAASKPFIFRNASMGLMPHLYMDKLTSAIKTTFSNGTIIAMYINMRDMKIYLDNDEVGEIQLNGRIITGNELKNIMATQFEKIINETKERDPIIG